MPKVVRRVNTSSDFKNRLIKLVTSTIQKEMIWSESAQVGTIINYLCFREVDFADLLNMQQNGCYAYVEEKLRTQVEIFKLRDMWNEFFASATREEI
jgi:hypothetical protein